MLVRIAHLLSLDPEDAKAVEGDAKSRLARIHMRDGKSWVVSLDPTESPENVEQLVSEITNAVNRALAIPPGLETVVLNVGAR